MPSHTCSPQQGQFLARRTDCFNERSAGLREVPTKAKATGWVYLNSSIDKEHRKRVVPLPCGWQMDSSLYQLGESCMHVKGSGCWIKKKEAVKNVLSLSGHPTVPLCIIIVIEKYYKGSLILSWLQNHRSVFCWYFYWILQSSSGIK